MDMDFNGICLFVCFSVSLKSILNACLDKAKKIEINKQTIMVLIIRNGNCSRCSMIVMVIPDITRASTASHGIYNKLIESEG